MKVVVRKQSSVKMKRDKDTFSDEQFSHWKMQFLINKWYLGIQDNFISSVDWNNKWYFILVANFILTCSNLNILIFHLKLWLAAWLISLPPKKKESESKVLPLTQIFMWNIFPSSGTVTELKIN